VVEYVIEQDLHLPYGHVDKIRIPKSPHNASGTSQTMLKQADTPLPSEDTHSTLNLRTHFSWIGPTKAPIGVEVRHRKAKCPGPLLRPFQNRLRNLSTPALEYANRDR